MKELLELYVSNFWVWLGISMGLTIVLKYIVRLWVGTIAALFGTPVHFGDVKNENHAHNNLNTRSE